MKGPDPVNQSDPPMISDAEVNAIHDSIFRADLGLPGWQTRYLVGITLDLTRRARRGNVPPAAIRTLFDTLMDAALDATVMTQDETETFAAIRSRLYNATLTIGTDN